MSIFLLLKEARSIYFWDNLQYKELNGGQRGDGGGEGDDFLQIDRPICNILNPLWAFLNSQYYDL